MRNKVLTFVLPLVTGLLLLVLWSGYIEIMGVPDYILPSPRSVFSAFLDGFVNGYILPHIFFTVKSMLLGYVLGCGLAVLLGALIAESAVFEMFVFPYVVLVQSMPKVALAPVLIVWFGFGIESKIVMVALICFFPVFINTIVGIRQADPDLIDVMRTVSASRLRIFLNVKLPSAVGAIFAGLQIAVVLGLIGAIVAEFVASKQGLGTVIQGAAIDLNTSLMLSTVFLLALIGLVGTTVVRWLHKRIAFWEIQGDTRIDTHAS